MFPELPEPPPEVVLPDEPLTAPGAVGTYVVFTHAMVVSDARRIASREILLMASLRFCIGTHSS